jgi:coproporphyrinogen III oxidase
MVGGITASSSAWTTSPPFLLRSNHRLATALQAHDGTANDAASTSDPAASASSSFDDFVSFLERQQDEIIQQLESIEQGAAVFFNDPWGLYNGASSPNTDDAAAASSGGRTRVLQGGRIFEKGACSLTVLRQGVLSADRAQAMSGRTTGNTVIAAGSTYRAAALSMVLHSRSPHVPTFRSDVRVFEVLHNNDSTEDETLAWYGGGADLTPYYLEDDDISFFHQCYKNLCGRYNLGGQASFDYSTMKRACDDYFYLPARQEHRGMGGIFYDDLLVCDESTSFTKDVVQTWMPSWIPLVQKRQDHPYTDDEKYWQLLRRGRYLEFNLLYDRGVKFGLNNGSNPRVEGVMVSAPPQMAFCYNHVPESGSREEALLQVLKTPRDWV